MTLGIIECIQCGQFLAYVIVDRTYSDSPDFLCTTCAKKRSDYIPTAAEEQA